MNDSKVSIKHVATTVAACLATFLACMELFDERVDYKIRSHPVIQKIADDVVFIREDVSHLRGLLEGTTN